MLPGTDVQAIAENLFWGSFINTGQTCAALKRLYVHDSVYEEVVVALSKLASTMPMGRGLDEGNVLGPLQNQNQFDIVSRLIDDAPRRAARALSPAATRLPNSALCFYRATVVADIDDGAPLVDEEQFGPVISGASGTWTSRTRSRGPMPPSKVSVHPSGR